MKPQSRVGGSDPGTLVRFGVRKYFMGSDLKPHRPSTNSTCQFQSYVIADRVYRGHPGELALSPASSRHPPRVVPQSLGHRPAWSQRLPGPQLPAEGGGEAEAPGTAWVRRAGSGAGVGASGQGPRPWLFRLQSRVSNWREVRPWDLFWKLILSFGLR